MEASGQGDGNAWRNLIVRAKSGDRDALDELILTFQNSVLKVAWRMLANADDARDAGQEVFVRFIKYIHKLDETKNPAGWFYRTTINVCRDLEKKSRRQSGLFFSTAGDSGRTLPETGNPGQADQLAQSENAERLARSLRQLPSRERAVIVLREIEGLETGEVARLLGSSEATVRSQACRAKVRLKRLLEKDL